MKLLGRLVCLFNGHKRGKLIYSDGRLGGMRQFACPRCGNRTEHKIKGAERATSSPTDGSAHFQETT